MNIQILEALANYEVEKMEVSEMEQIIYDAKLDNFQSMEDNEVINYIIEKHGEAWLKDQGYTVPKRVDDFDNPLC